MCERDLSRLVCLVGLLREKSLCGFVRWERTPARDMFRAKVGDYFVEVEEVVVEGVGRYFLRVVSCDGRTVDEVMEGFGFGGGFNGSIGELFFEARRVACEASKVVDELIGVLGGL